MPDQPVAIVTGASSGIGAATARELAQSGHRVVLVARRRERLEEVAQQCRVLGPGADVEPADLSQRGAAEAVVRGTHERHGRLDVLVNNAGFGIHARVHDTTDKQMRAMFEVNYFAVFEACRAAAPKMIEQGAGHLFNVSSVLGKRGSPFNGAYCATKFAVCGLTDSLRVELRPHGVFTTSVCPGLTDTEFFDRVEGGANPGARNSFRSLRSLQSPEVVARAIASRVGRYTPELVFTPGGKFLAKIAAISPRLSDRMMQAYLRKLEQAEASDNAF